MIGEPLWLAVLEAVATYMVGLLITRSWVLLIDDGPTFRPRLDAAIFAAVILLWPVTWALLAVVVVIGFVVRLVVP